MNIKKITGFGGAALFALSFTVNAGTVDLFTTQQAIIKDTADGGTGVDSTAGSAVDVTILGGFRDLNANAITGSVAGSLGTSIGVVTQAPVGSHLNFSNDAGVTGTGNIQWDGDDTAVGHISGLNETGLGGVDLTAGGTLNAFLLETISSDLGYEFTVTAYTSATQWTEISFLATAVIDDGTPELSTIDFAGFTTVGLCGQNTQPPLPAGVLSITCSDALGDPGGFNVVDLTNLGALDVNLNTGAGTVDIDLRLGSVTTIPEPTMLGLLGMAMLAGGLTRFTRRRTNRA